MTKLTDDQKEILKRQASEQMDMQIRHAEERNYMLEGQRKERESAKIDMGGMGGSAMQPGNQRGG